MPGDKEYWLRAGHGVKTEIKMPTLKEALELCKDRIIVNIDKGYDYYDEIISLTDSLGHRTGSAEGEKSQGGSR